MGDVNEELRYPAGSIAAEQPDVDQLDPADYPYDDYDDPDDGESIQSILDRQPNAPRD